MVMEEISCLEGDQGDFTFCLWWKEENNLVNATEMQLSYMELLPIENEQLAIHERYRTAELRR